MPISLQYILGFVVIIAIMGFCINLFIRTKGLVLKIVAILFLTGSLCSVLTMIAGAVQGLDFVGIWQWFTNALTSVFDWLTNFFNNLLSGAKNVEEDNATTLTNIITTVFIK